MTEQNTPQYLYDRLLAINLDAFSAGLFDVAYHALAAALSCAKKIGTDEPLVHIGRVSREQIAWIDQHHPEYEHSSLAARRRAHDSIFITLARQSDAVLQMRKTSRTRKLGGLG